MHNVSWVNPARVFVHPNGLCESADVSDGTRVWAYVHVLPGAAVGSDCNICDGAFIEGGATVGNRVTVKNHVLIFESVTAEDDVFLGQVSYSRTTYGRKPISSVVAVLCNRLLSGRARPSVRESLWSAERPSVRMYLSARAP